MRCGGRRLSRRQKAGDAFEDARGSRLSPSERKNTLIRLAKLIKRNARELAVMESRDSGKTIYDCETVDLPETIRGLLWHAELIDKIYDQTAPASEDHIAMILREPVGVDPGDLLVVHWAADRQVSF